MATSELGLAETQTFLWRRYFELIKPKVVGLILFTALVGMLLATPGMVPLPTLFFGLLGIGLCAGSGAALNHVVDQRIDALMDRTRERPLPSGDLDARHALVFALGLAAVSVLVLVVFVNPLTALLTFVAFIGYAVIYTMYLKRATPQNIVWGGIAGAMPPLLGWTAVTGEVSVEGLLLALLVFVWTPPHFWALAIKRRDEYARADIPMLPVTHGLTYTKLQILIYSLLLFWVSLMPFMIHMSGPLYLVGALGLGSGFVYQSVRLLCSQGDTLAMKTFGYSVFYLSVLFTFLLADHYLGLV